MVRAMVCAAPFLVALLLPLAAGEMNAGWSCDGPLPSVHGPSSGDLVAGEIELLLHSTPLDPREAHAEVLGSTVELELVAPPGIDGLEGFLITASKGFVRAADLNGQRSDCTHGGVTHVPTPSKKRKYTVDFGLPHKYGDVDLKVVALAGSREWYESTLHFYVGEEEADAATHKSRSSRQMILILVVVCATLGTTLYVGISSWPTEAPHRQKWQ